MFVSVCETSIEVEVGAGFRGSQHWPMWQYHSITGRNTARPHDGTKSIDIKNLKKAAKRGRCL